MTITKKIALICFGLAVCACAVGQQPASPSYVLKSQALSGGAGQSQSPTYKLRASVGQTFIGQSSSPSFKTQVGFEPTIGIDLLADLKFSNTTFTINPVNVSRGGETSAFFAIQNAGSKKVESDIAVKAYLSSNTTFDISDVELPASIVYSDDLDPGGVIDKTGTGVQVAIPAETSLGSFFLLLYLDPANSIAERVENNNVASANITVIQGGLPPVIGQYTTVPFVAGTSISISATDSDNGVKSVELFHKKISGTEFESVQLSNTGLVYSVTMQEGWADEFGMEGYFIAHDNGGLKTAKPATNYFWYREPIAIMPTPLAEGAFNGKEKSYRMFSIPYEPNDPSVANIFETSLGKYDKAKWRLLHYKDGKYQEYPKFLKIELGKAYWFNTFDKNFEIDPGAGQVYDVSAGPFEMTLVKGWNQVGNPYPFPISWEAVTGSIDVVGKLNFYKNGEYSDTEDVFMPWEGAFVHLDQETPLQLEIPVTARTEASGKIRNEPGADLDSESWSLTIRAEIGGLGSHAGIGMHPQAKMSKDKFDAIGPPRFNSFVELFSAHPEFFSHRFARDVVPSTESYEWTFSFASSVEQAQAVLSWDNNQIESQESALILIDLADARWVDMKKVNSYSFTSKEPRKFRIMFSRSGEITPNVTMVGDAYPNPFNSVITVPVLAAEKGERQIEIYDGMGRMVKTITVNFTAPGIFEVIWDATDDKGREVNSGLLYYRLSGQAGVFKRIIKR